MAMGRRKHRERQEALWYRAELAEAPGHPFYRKLEEKLKQGGFDQFCEEVCKPFYADGVGRPSLVPGIYFRLMLVGFFEGLDSERGIAWRAADSLSLRQFLGFGMDEATPDHVTISRTRRLVDEATHQKVFAWVLAQLARAGLVKGRTIGVDSTTLEANAAMKSIVRRDTAESYSGYLQRLARAEGMEADAASLRRMDRKRAKKMSNEEWVNPNDPEAEISRLKDGRTELAYKVEEAVDMESGAIVAVTTHGGAAADTATVRETVCAAGEAVAELLPEPTAGGTFAVHEQGVVEVVADKGYHSNEVMRELRDLPVRSYVAEPERGRRRWTGREAEQQAVYANRRRIQGERGKRLQSQRGDKVERNFAHQFDTGGLDRLYLRGRSNVHKRLLLQAAACNLALLMRSLYGTGKPRAAADRAKEATFSFFQLISALSRLQACSRIAPALPIRSKPDLTHHSPRACRPRHYPI
jgi:transposase